MDLGPLRGLGPLFSRNGAILGHSPIHRSHSVIRCDNHNRAPKWLIMNPCKQGDNPWCTSLLFIFKKWYHFRIKWYLRKQNENKNRIDNEQKRERFIILTCVRNSAHSHTINMRSFYLHSICTYKYLSWLFWIKMLNPYLHYAY